MWLSTSSRYDPPPSQGRIKYTYFPSIVYTHLAYSYSLILQKKNIWSTLFVLLCTYYYYAYWN